MQIKLRGRKKIGKLGAGTMIRGDWLLSQKPSERCLEDSLVDSWLTISIRRGWPQALNIHSFCRNPQLLQNVKLLTAFRGSDHEHSWSKQKPIIELNFIYFVCAWVSPRWALIANPNRVCSCRRLSKSFVCGSNVVRSGTNRAWRAFHFPWARFELM